MNAAVSALRCFFGVTLGRGDAKVGMTTVREPRRLPVILSPEEVARLLDHAPGLKHRAALSVAYGAGLRAAEVVSLKPSDIDSDRMVIRVEQGKGRKDRYAKLSDPLLDSEPQIAGAGTSEFFYRSRMDFRPAISTRNNSVLPLVGVVSVVERAKIDDLGAHIGALAENGADKIQGAVKLGDGPFFPLRVNELITCGVGCSGNGGHAKNCQKLYKESRQTFVLQLGNGNETSPIAGKLFQSAP